MAQIKEIEVSKEQIVNELKQNASWYPEEYFGIGIVNLVIRQIQNAKANSLTQAFVQYEASMVNG